MGVLSTVSMVVVILLLLFVFVAIVRSVLLVKQNFAVIVERLGKFQAEHRAGLHFLIPFVDSIRSKLDLREQVVSFQPQTVITSDNLQVGIDTVIYYQITDPRRVTYEISNFLMAIEQLTATTLRNVIGSMDLEQALTSRELINDRLRGVLDQETGRWGIRVSRVELKSIDPPPSIQGSMEQQMRAERDRRAAILTAEGVKQSQILTAEGDKQSAILRAEGQAQSAILKAQGESRAILQVFDAIHRGNADPKLLAYQYLQTLPKIANGSSSKMWIVPTEFTAALEGIAGALGGGGQGGGPGPDSPADDDGGHSGGVDLSDTGMDLGIASHLAQTALPSPEQALAEARGEVQTASEEASDDQRPREDSEDSQRDHQAGRGPEAGAPGARAADVADSAASGAVTSAREPGGADQGNQETQEQAGSAPSAARPVAQPGTGSESAGTPDVDPDSTASLPAYGVPPAHGAQPVPGPQPAPGVPYAPGAPGPSPAPGSPGVPPAYPGSPAPGGYGTIRPGAGGPYDPRGGYGQRPQ